MYVVDLVCSNRITVFFFGVEKRNKCKEPKIRLWPLYNYLSFVCNYEKILQDCVVGKVILYKICW